MESVEGTINHIRYHKFNSHSRTGTPFLIAQLDCGVVVLGEMSASHHESLIGQRFRFYGRYTSNRKGPSYPDDFRFDAYDPIDGEAPDPTDYLLRNVEGIGAARARIIIEHFGTDTLHVLQTQPERLEEIEGFSPELIEIIRNHFETTDKNPSSYSRLWELLRPFKVPRTFVEKVIRDFGSNAIAIIENNPYLLLDYPRISWEKVDELARSILKIDVHHPERQKAAIMESVARIINDGHTVMDRAEIVSTSFNLLGFSPDPVLFDVLVSEERLYRDDDDRFSPYSLALDESYIARRLALLYRHGRPLPRPITSEGLVHDQSDAWQMLVDHPVCLLVGAPGTGKTYLMSRFITTFAREFGANLRVMAPTGKAAKRDEELIFQNDSVASIECSTIHRALGIAFNEKDDDEEVPEESARPQRGRPFFGFAHGELNPLSGQLFVIDEQSMVDVSIFAAVLAAIPLGARIIIVGDPNQLQSIRPGATLRDMIQGGFPCAKLNTIVRSDSAGTVVKACHAMISGRTPRPATKLQLPLDNWRHTECDDPQEIADTIVSLYMKVHAGSKLGLDPIRDVQIISAQRDGKEKFPFFCNPLNDRISRLINGDNNEGSQANARFRIGDKVIRRKNKNVPEMIPRHDDVFRLDRDDTEYMTWRGQDYTLSAVPVVNGDMGIVEDIIPNPHGNGQSIVVRFFSPDRLCCLPLGKCHLELAYATTVHLCQGSGFKYVIAPVSEQFFWDRRGHRGIWSWELFFTMISRTEMILWTVGKESSIGIACGRRTSGRRRTRLADLVRAEADNLTRIGLDSTPELEDDGVVRDLPTPDRKTPTAIERDQFLFTY